MGLIGRGEDRLVILLQPFQQILSAPLIEFSQGLIKQQQRSRTGMFLHPLNFSELQRKERGTDLSPGTIGAQVNA